MNEKAVQRGIELLARFGEPDDMWSPLAVSSPALFLAVVRRKLDRQHAEIVRLRRLIKAAKVGMDARRVGGEWSLAHTNAGWAALCTMFDEVPDVRGGELEHAENTPEPEED